MQLLSLLCYVYTDTNAHSYRHVNKVVGKISSGVFLLLV